MPSSIDVTVAAVIEYDNKFLIVEETVGGKRVFNQPAGHLEADETLEAAVIREVLEETGYQFTPHSLLGIFAWSGESRDYLRITFSGDAKPPSGAQSLDDGIIATHWLTKAELSARAAMLRSPMVLACIERYEEGIHYPLSAICELLPDIGNVANIA